MTFEIERREHPNGRCLRLSMTGDLDLYTAPRLDDALVAAEGEKWPEIVLDLSDLGFMDSSGLRLLARAHARAEQDGRRVLVVQGPEHVARVLRLTGLDRELEVVEAYPED
ncbi:MAG TPA: STAS domain-containing protein [Solirubrobacteraceae bacterium]|nr:STAS domain-containing protein [Solirubrobacteraceae bacterium]